MATARFVDDPLRLEAMAAIQKAGIAVGQRWRTRSGQVVRVAAVGVAKPSLEPMVSCVDARGDTWFYLLTMFIGRAMAGNSLVPRFSLCED